MAAALSAHPRCVCELRHAGTVVEVDELPAQGIVDLDDRRMVVNVAKLMLVLHHPHTAARDWGVDEDDTDQAYHITVRWPADTWFNVRQLALIEQINEHNVIDVWVQPSSGAVKLCATVRKHRAERQVTVDEILIIQTRVHGADTEERNRVTKKRRAEDA